jgi:hypothetical protein
MGQFLALALVESNLKKTKTEIVNFSSAGSGEGESATETIEENNVLYSKVKPIAKNSSAVLFPAFSTDFYYCSQYISEKLDTKVLTVQIHDSDVWLAFLFDKGKELTRFLSDPGLIGETRENWVLNYDVIQRLYKITEEAGHNILKLNVSGSHGTSALTIEDDLFRFLHDLNYPVDKIREYDAEYKSIIPARDLQRRAKAFLTVDDIRKTKNYSPGLVGADNELMEMFKDEFEAMEPYKKCQTCGSAIINDEYFLNADVLTMQLFGECPVCKSEGKKVIVSVAFDHRMEEMIAYLNK